MPTISTGPFPVGKECECVRCGTRFADLAAFDAHIPADPDAELTCVTKQAMQNPKTGPRRPANPQDRRPYPKPENRGAKDQVRGTILRHPEAVVGLSKRGGRPSTQGTPCPQHLSRLRPCKQCAAIRQQKYRQRKKEGSNA